MFHDSVFKLPVLVGFEDKVSNAERYYYDPADQLGPLVRLMKSSNLSSVAMCPCHGPISWLLFLQVLGGPVCEKIQTVVVVFF